MRSILFCGFFSLLLLTGCNQSPRQSSANESTNSEPAKTETNSAAAEPAKASFTAAETEKLHALGTNEVAVMKTTDGEMVIEFWPDVAPKTVENFKTLANKEFYNGTAFHRIVDGFMIQGGDPLTKDLSKEDRWGTGDPGYKIKAEFNDRPHVRGVISMARSQNPDSAGSQFFICLGDAPALDRQYTAFGKLVAGDAVLEKIGKTPVTVNRFDEPSKPTKRVEIKSVEIVPANSVK